jgi:hypothetical protein
VGYVRACVFQSLLSKVHLLWAMHASSANVDAEHTTASDAVPIVNLLLDDPNITVGPMPLDTTYHDLIMLVHAIAMILAWALLSAIGATHAPAPLAATQRETLTDTRHACWGSGVRGDVCAHVQALVPSARGAAGADDAARHPRPRYHRVRQEPAGRTPLCHASRGA